MIVGSGLIAKAFQSRKSADCNKTVIFASGVSNSSERDVSAFAREKLLLRDTLLKHDGDKIIYFSTCSIEDPELKHSPYCKHKMEMENLVRTSSDFSIFRLPQVVGKTSNPHTLTNFIYNQIKSGCEFKVWLNAKRCLIDVEDVVSIVTTLIHRNIDTVNIASPFSISILDLVKIFEMVLEKNANYSIVEAGGAYLIDTDLALSVASSIGVLFDENYVEKVIRKYYAK